MEGQPKELIEETPKATPEETIVEVEEEEKEEEEVRAIATRGENIEKRYNLTGMNSTGTRKSLA